MPVHVAPGATAVTGSTTTAPGGLRLGQIRMRDPFLLTLPDESYRLYGTTDAEPWNGPGQGFDAYRSRDLRTWEGPVRVFSPPEDFRGKSQFWAPEVHPWRGGWLMLASFADARGRRGSYALTATSPDGPFTPVTGRPLTPQGWMCLDSTLHTDLAGDPWLVFGREWVQAVDGEIWAQRVSADLDRTLSPPQRLFSAREARWTRPLALAGRSGGQAWIADGPYLTRRGPRELLLFWSSRGEKGCAVGVSRSPNGSVLGPWQHDPEPLWDQDGAHPMVTSTHSGGPVLVLHTPDRTPLERPVLLTLASTPDGACFTYRRAQDVEDRPGATGREVTGDTAPAPLGKRPRGSRGNWGRGALPGTSVVILGHDGTAAERQRCEAAVRRLLTLRRTRLRLDWDLRVEDTGEEVRGWLEPPSRSSRS